MIKGGIDSEHASRIPPHFPHTLCPFLAFSRHDVPREGQYSKLTTIVTAIKHVSRQQDVNWLSVAEKKRSDTCSIISETYFKPITRQLMGICSSKDDITSNTSRYNLCDDILVRLLTTLRLKHPNIIMYTTKEFQSISFTFSGSEYQITISMKLTTHDL